MKTFSKDQTWLALDLPPPPHGPAKRRNRPARGQQSKNQIRWKQTHSTVANIIIRTLACSPDEVTLTTPMADLGADDLDAEEIVYFCAEELKVSEETVWKQVKVRPSSLTAERLTNLLAPDAQITPQTKPAPRTRSSARQNVGPYPSYKELAFG